MSPRSTPTEQYISREEYQKILQKELKKARRKKEAVRVLLAIYALGMLGAVSFILSQDRGAHLIKDAPFIVDVVYQSFSAQTEMHVVVEHDHGFEAFQPFDKQDVNAIQEQETKAFDFLTQQFGPPAPWNNGATVFLMNGEELEHNPEFEHMSATEGRMDIFPKVKFLVFIEPGVEKKASILVHELKHAWIKDDQNMPQSWTEGQAIFAEYSYLVIVEGIDRDTVPFNGHLPSEYDKLNTPALKTISFDGISGNLDNATLADFMAREAWYRWNELHPDFFTEMSKKVAEFYEKEHRQPTFDEMQLIAENLEPSFAQYCKENFILQNRNVAVPKW